MRMPATDLVSILRGETTNAFGDTEDAPTVVQDRIPMSILETNRATTRRAADRPQTVTYFTGRCSAAVDVRVEDRIRSETNGAIYVVTSVSTVRSPITTNDTRIDLERVGTGTL